MTDDQSFPLEEAVFGGFAIPEITRSTRHLRRFAKTGRSPVKSLTRSIIKKLPGKVLPRAVGFAIPGLNAAFWALTAIDAAKAIYGWMSGSSQQDSIEGPTTTSVMPVSLFNEPSITQQAAGYASQQQTAPDIEQMIELLELLGQEPY